MAGAALRAGLMGWFAAPTSSGMAARELPVDVSLDPNEQPVTKTITIATVAARAVIQSQRARRALGLGTMGASTGRVRRPLG